MKKNLSFLRNALIWIIFILVILVHGFLCKNSYDKCFFIQFNCTGSFLRAISQDYQHIVNSKLFFLDPAAFTSIQISGGAGHWPIASLVIGLWTLLLLPLKLFFLLNVFYLSMIMLAIYRSMRILIEERFYSMLAAVIFASYWIVAVLMRAFEVHLPTTVCIAWGFYWYLRCRFFTKFLESALMGIFIVLALYCDRLTPGVFLFSLFLVPENFKRKRSLLSMVMVLFFVGICCWPFYSRWIAIYLMNKEGLTILFSAPAAEYSAHTSPLKAYGALLMTPRFGIGHLIYYFISLTEELIGYGFTALLIGGGFFLGRLGKPKAGILLIATFIPLLFFMLIPKKDYIYIFPLCIYFAMISSAGIFFIRQAFVRYVLVGIVAVLGFWQFPSLTWQSSSAWFLSQRFAEMKKQEIPGLFLNSLTKFSIFDTSFGPEKALSISKKISPFLEIVSSQGKTPAVIVPGSDGRLIFFLNYLHPKVAFVASHDILRVCSKEFKKDFLYILHSAMTDPVPFQWRGRNTLMDDHIPSNQIVRKMLTTRGVDPARASTSHLAVVFGEILGMRDFYSKIDVEQIRPMIRKHARALLDRAQRGDTTLSEADFRKLNRALLETLYPENIWKNQGVEDNEVCITDYCWDNVTRVYSSEDGSTVLYRLQSPRDFPSCDGGV